MQPYLILTVETAPERSKPVLRDLNAAFGAVPNVAGAMATSPVLINGFIGLFRTVHAGSFTEAELQVLLLTNAVTNACPWAVAFHTGLALREGLEAADVAALRAGRQPTNARVAALSSLTRALIEKRGRLDDHDCEAFFSQGFSREQLLEAITVAAASTITNYTGNVTRPPLEPAFESHRWVAA